MANQRDLHLVSYDIRDPKRWRRAYKVIRGYGVRVQYSVFRVEGTKARIARLRWELARVLDAEDALLVVRLCRSCAESLEACHSDGQWPESEKGFKIVG